MFELHLRDVKTGFKLYITSYTDLYTALYYIDEDIHKYLEGVNKTFGDFFYSLESRDTRGNISIHASGRVNVEVMQ